MKQRITKRQLGELSKRGRKNLRREWVPREGDWVLWCAGSRKYVLVNQSTECCFWPDKEDLLPLVSIGQMIEFLGEDWVYKVYEVSPAGEMNVIGKKNLCDALWEKIKELYNDKEVINVKKFIFPYANKEGRCHDCGVSAGEWHYDGCDVERCPFTLTPRIGCDCGKCGELKLTDKIPFGFETEATRRLAQKDV